MTFKEFRGKFYFALGFATPYVLAFLMIMSVSGVFHETRLACDDIGTTVQHAEAAMMHVGVVIVLAFILGRLSTKPRGANKTSGEVDGE